METQQKNAFDLVSLRKITINVAILALPQLLTALSGLDYGKYGAIVAVVLSTLGYIIKGYVQGQPGQIPMATSNSQDTNNSL